MKVINYSNQHVHILSRAGGETCHLARNWNRFLGRNPGQDVLAHCTAGTDHQLKDADPIRKREDALYYDGNEWRDARKEHAR